MERKEQNNLNESIRKVVKQQNEEALGSAPPNISPDARETQDPGKFNTIGGIETQSPTTSGNKKSGTKSSFGTSAIPTGKVTVYGGPGKGFVEVDDDDERLSWFRQNSRSAASNLGVQLDYLRKFNPSSELIPSLTRQIEIQTAIADGSPVTPLAKDFEDERKISMTTGAVMSDDEIMQKLAGVPEYSSGRNPKVIANTDNKQPKVKTPGQEDDNLEPVLDDKRSKVKDVIATKEVKSVDDVLSEYQPETVQTVKNKLRTYTRDGFAGVKRQPFNTETYKLAAGENIVKKELRKAKGDPSLAFDALAKKAKNINMIRTVVLDELAKAVEDGNTDMINVADAAAKVGARYVDIMRRLPEDQQTHTAVMFQLAALQYRNIIAQMQAILKHYDGDMFDPRFMQRLFAQHGIMIQPETIENFIVYGKQSKIIPNRKAKRAKIAQRRAIEKRLMKEGFSKEDAHKESYKVLKEETGADGAGRPIVPADALKDTPLQTGMFGFQKKGPGGISNQPDGENDKEEDEKDDDDDTKNEPQKGGEPKTMPDEKGGGLKIPGDKDTDILDFLNGKVFSKDDFLDRLGVALAGDFKDAAQGILFNEAALARIFQLLRDFGLDLPEGDSFIAAIRDLIDKGQQDVLDHKLQNKGQVGPGDKTEPKDSNNPKNPVMNPDQKGNDGDTKNTNPLDLPHLLPPDWFNPNIFDPNEPISPGDPIFNPEKYPGMDEDPDNPTPGAPIKYIPNPDDPDDPFNLSEEKGENSPLFFPDLKGDPFAPEGDPEDGGKDVETRRRYVLLRKLFNIPDDFDLETKTGPGIILPGILIAIMGGLTGEMFDQLLTLMRRISALFDADDKPVGDDGKKQFAEGNALSMAVIGLIVFFMQGSLGISGTILLMFFGGSSLERLIRKALGQDIGEEINDLIKEDKDDSPLQLLKGDEKGGDVKEAKGDGILDLIFGELLDKDTPVKKYGKDDDSPSINDNPGATMEVPDFVPPSTPPTGPGGGGGGLPF